LIFYLVFQGFLFDYHSVSGQVVYNESFDQPPLPLGTGVGTSVLPYGWSSLQNLNAKWERVSSSFFPTCSPRTGNGMLRFNSVNTAQGQTNFISSKRLDFRNWVSGTVSVSFYMYRNSNPGNDSISVAVNTIPWFNNPNFPSTFILLSENASSATAIPRTCSGVPVAITCATSSTTYSPGAWNLYTFNIPVASIPVSQRDSVYVIVNGRSGGWMGNIYIDDFQVTYYPQSPVYLNASVLNQITNITAVGKLKQQIIQCYIDIDGESTGLVARNLVFNTTGSDNPVTDIANAKLYYTGGNYSQPGDTVNCTLIQNIPSPWNTNYTFTNPMPLVHGRNHFYIAYDIGTAALVGNHVDAEWVSLQLHRTKAGCTGNSGTLTITVPDTSGLSAGMSVTGTGIGAGALITSLSGINTVNLSVPNSGNVNGNLIFISNPTPVISTLTGNRLIKTQLYTTPVTGPNCSLCDFPNPEDLAGVRLDGESGPTNGIYTGYQPAYPKNMRVGTGHYNTFNGYMPWFGNVMDAPPVPPYDSCYCEPFLPGTNTYSEFPLGECPLSDQDDSYEYFEPAQGTTTILRTDGITNYQLSTWSGGRALMFYQHI
jgi:hypothetical protein